MGAAARGGQVGEPVGFVGQFHADNPRPGRTLRRQRRIAVFLKRLAQMPDQVLQAERARSSSGRPIAWASSTAPSGVTRNRFSLRTPNRRGR
jgi:hypothetical protein